MKFEKKLKNSIKKEFDNELVYNEKYLDPIQDGQGGGKQATPLLLVFPL